MTPELEEALQAAHEVVDRLRLIVDEDIICIRGLYDLSHKHFAVTRLYFSGFEGALSVESLQLLCCAADVRYSDMSIDNSRVVMCAVINGLSHAPRKSPLTPRASSSLRSYAYARLCL